MASEPKITLYDLASTLTPQAWSPMCWRVRLVLNYKCIPYKTIWINFTDIKSTVQDIGGKPTDPHPDGGELYTLPALVDNTTGTPVVLTDSLAITEYLEGTYPDRPVFPKEGKALEYAFADAVRSILVPHMWKIILPGAWNILNDRDKLYYRETRERWYGEGKKLEEWCPDGPEGEALWENFRDAWDRLARILDKNGPDVIYVAGGNRPTRGDMIIVSILAWIIAVLPEDWDKRIRHWNGGRWERLWNLTEDIRAVH